MSAIDLGFGLADVRKDPYAGVWFAASAQWKMNTVAFFPRAATKLLYKPSWQSLAG